MAKEKTSFIIRKKYRTQIEKLDNETAGILFKAIMKLQDGEVLENTNPMVDMLLSIMADEWKSDDERYTEVCDRNRENAKKRREKEKIQVNATVCDRIPLDTKNADYDNDSDIDSDSNNKIIKENLIKENSITNLVREFEKDERLVRLYGGTDVVKEWLKYKQAKKDRAYKTTKGFLQQMKVIVKDIQFGQPRGDLTKRFEFAVNQAMENERKGIYRDDKIEQKYQGFKSMTKKDDE